MAFRTFALAAALTFPALAQTAPAPLYKKVARVAWAVKDLDAVLKGWTKLGLTVFFEPNESSLTLDYRGKASTERVRWAAGALGDTYIDFIQPLGAGPFEDAIAKHGEGIVALMYAAPDEATLESEIARMKAAGTGVLVRGTQQVEGVEVKFVQFDTAEKGKYTLGLIYIPADVPEPPPTAKDIKQFAFVIRNFEPVSAYWKSVGFPALSINSVDGSDQQYRGKPVKYGQQLGWQRHGTVPFEWCVPPEGAPTVYRDFLDKRGEGPQHIAFNVDDMDKAIADYAAMGYPNVQSGAWGQKGKPGSGRFAYIDTTSAGGVMIELLWNYR